MFVPPAYTVFVPPAYTVFVPLHTLCLSPYICWRFLTGVLVIFDMVDAPGIHQGSCMSIFKYLPSSEVLHLLCVSRASSWSLRGSWRFLRGVLVVFEMVDASRIHPGSYISIFKFLPSWKVVQLLGSPERHPSVILGVYEDAGGS